MMSRSTREPAQCATGTRQHAVDAALGEPGSVDRNDLTGVGQRVTPAPECALRFGKRPHQVPAHDRVEGLTRDGFELGTSDDEVHGETGARGRRPADRDHSLGDVDRGDVVADLGTPQCEEAGAGADIEDALRRVTEVALQEATPRLALGLREQAVTGEGVVGGCGRVPERADLGFGIGQVVRCGSVHATHSPESSCHRRRG